LDSEDKIGSVLKGINTIDCKNSISEIFLTLLLSLLDISRQLYSHTSFFTNFFNHINKVKAQYNITSIDSFTNTNSEEILNGVTNFMSTIQEDGNIFINDDNKGLGENEWISLHDEDFERYIKDLTDEEQKLFTQQRKNYQLEKRNQWNEIKLIVDCFWNDINTPEILNLIQTKNPQIFENKDISSKIHWLSDKVFLEGIQIHTIENGKEIIKDFNNIEVDEDDFPANIAEALEFARCYDYTHPDQQSVIDRIFTLLNNLVAVCQILSTPDEKFDSFILLIHQEWKNLINSKKPDYGTVGKSLGKKFYEIFQIEQVNTTGYISKLIFHNKSYIPALLSKFDGPLKDKFFEIVSSFGVDTTKVETARDFLNHHLDKIIKDEEIKQKSGSLSSN
jgi:hypothetical protein